VTLPYATAPNPSIQPSCTVHDAPSAAAPNPSIGTAGTSDADANANANADTGDVAEDANIESSADGGFAMGVIVDISSDEEDEPHCGDKRTHSGAPKAAQLKAHEIKVVLDEWSRRVDAAAASNSDLLSRRSLLKWAKAESRCPLLQRKQLKNGSTTRRSILLLLPKAKVSLYAVIKQCHIPVGSVIIQRWNESLLLLSRIYIR
jgi:hypothetical protein